MTNKYLHAGTRYDTKGILSDDIYNNYLISGKNTGNLLIGYACHALIGTSYYGNIFKPLTEQESIYYRKSYDKIILASSNFINKYSDFGVVADNLEKIDLPVVVLGIGAQANSLEEDISNELKSGTIKFAKVISERSELIGVRGEYTANILNKLGIKNISIIGCPSYYLSKDPSFQIIKKPFSEVRSIATNITSYKQQCKVNKLLLRKAFEKNYDLIGQMEWPLEVLKKEGARFDKYSKLEENLHYYQNLFDMDVLNSFIKTNFYEFYDVPVWLDHMRKYDFVIGTRFHGAMVAIQAGVPALTIVHDSRTHELCEYLNLPYIKEKNVTETIEDSQLYDLADYNKFNKEYGYKFLLFLEFLEKNKLNICIDNLFLLRKFRQRLIQKERDIFDAELKIRDKNSIFKELDDNAYLKDNAIKRADSAIRKYNEELYSVYTSRSWRYTAPLRKIGNLIRSLKKERDI